MEATQQAADLTAFIECDHAFHCQLYAISGRERLIRMIGELQDRSRRHLPHLYQAWQMAENPLEAHRPILSAIRARDPALVERLTREHMEQAADRLLKVIVREAEERRAARAPSGRR
jgi:DNA-binding GntR family transcriptional regulator